MALGEGDTVGSRFEGLISEGEPRDLWVEVDVAGVAGLGTKDRIGEIMGFSKEELGLGVRAGAGDSSFSIGAGLGA